MPSIEQHQQVMLAESAKQQPDEAIVNDRMARTLSDRRQLITTSSIPDILLKYPCLANDSQVGVRNCSVVY
jgi:hypothetical protein